MKTASAARIAAQFENFLETSQEQPVLITRGGKPVAVLVAVQNKAEAEQLAIRRSRTLRSVVEEAQLQLQKGEAIPRDEFWQQVEKSARSRRLASLRTKKNRNGSPK